MGGPEADDRSERTSVTERQDIEALVLGRVGADLYPLQHETPLEEVRTFERFVGGCAGNVATGLARLGVRTAIVSAVGDDGHGRFVRSFLDAEGVDTRWLATHPTLRTALAFCEVWPPDDFPTTFYRLPTCPDWELRLDQLPLDAIRGTRLLYATGTGLAREPSRTATLGALAERSAGRGEPSSDGSGPLVTILDLDWKPVLWDEPTAFPTLVRRALPSVDIVLGGVSEFAGAALVPPDSLAFGPWVAVLKRGPDGVRVFRRDATEDVPGLPVPVTNGLGAGDAFAAAFGAALLAGLDVPAAARRANAAGAIVATRLSCSAAMPRPQEIDALLAGSGVPSAA